MKLPRVRFTVRLRLRSLLILVLLGGIAAWGLTRWWSSRYDEYLFWASYHSQYEAIERQAAATFRESLPRARSLAAEITRLRERFATSGNSRFLADLESLAAAAKDHESNLLSAIAECDRAAEWHKARSGEFRRAALFPWLDGDPTP